MAFEWVKDVIQGHLASGLPEYGGLIAWKNLKFEPAGLTLWIKAIYTPISEDAITLGINGDNELSGFLQIGIYQRADTGTSESDIAINRINSLFKTPQRLNAPSGNLLRLTSKQFSQGGQTSLADFTAGGTEDVWDANYISIYWLAREPR